jgi:hypothetical protein
MFPVTMASNGFIENNSELPNLSHHETTDNTDLDYSSFTSDCSSLNSSLYISPLTQTTSMVHRRPSVASSETWEPGPSFSVSSLDTTAPSTPIKSGPHLPLDMIMSEPHGISMMGPFESGYCYLMAEQTPAFDTNASWFDDTTGTCAGEQSIVAQNCHQHMHPFSYPADGRYDLSLSRGIFPEDNVDLVSEEWRTSPDNHPWVGETMDPSKTFLEPITPPRPYNASPISPMTLDPYTPTPVQPKSSPVGLCSPLELKSQRRTARLSKKTPKRAGSLLNSLPPVIKATTKFRCEHPDCKDKAFKRAEHLKRHMRCHSDKRPFKCEMCGRGFSRSDNRRAHYDTHGNKTKGRNAYYEECDPESEKFKYGKKANTQKMRVSVRSKL